MTSRLSGGRFRTRCGPARLCWGPRSRHSSPPSPHRHRHGGRTWLWGVRLPGPHAAKLPVAGPGWAGGRPLLREPTPFEATLPEDLGWPGTRCRRAVAGRSLCPGLCSLGFFSPARSGASAERCTDFAQSPDSSWRRQKTRLRGFHKLKTNFKLRPPGETFPWN